MQLEPKITAKPNQVLYVKDLASVYCKNKHLKESVMSITISKVPKNQKNTVIFVLDIVKAINQSFGNIDLVVYGDPEILVNIIQEKKSQSFIDYLKVLIVCIILFIGAGLAIIYFHEDVNMEETHKAIYFLITGETNERPLILQIPYSIGIGVGMSAFFNHVLKKRWKKEPSPLEVEMHLYNKNIDDYILEKTKHIRDN